MKILFILLFFLCCDSLWSQGESLYEVEILPFCSDKYDEYNFVPYKKGAFLVSNHPDGGLKQIKDQQGENLSSVYFQSNLNSRNTSINKISVRTKNHIGSFCLNENNNCLIFTAQKSAEDLTLGLFISRKRGPRWSRPKLIFDGYAEMNLMDPFLSVTGDTLFFVANMPGGFGGTDIYMAIGELGFWPTLRCLEENVNTSFNERYPKYYGQKLYYSSTRVYGNGGLDIYSIDLTTSGFVAEPFHFPSPVNSDADDFAYCPIDDETGYFSSNRNGNDDIFKVKVNFPQFECDEYIETARCFEFYEEGDNETDSSLYEFEWVFSDGNKYRGEVVNHCFGETGDYVIQLNIIDKASDELLKNVASYEIEIIDPDQMELQVPEKASRGQSINCSTPKDKIDLNANYFWDFGDGEFGNGRVVPHTYKREGQYHVRLGKITTVDGVETKTCTSQIITITK